MKRRFASFAALALLASSSILQTPWSSLRALEVAHVVGEGDNPDSALNSAAAHALGRALEELNLQATEEQKRAILNDAGTYFPSRSIKPIKNDASGVKLEGTFQVNDRELRTFLGSQGATDISSQLAHPQIAFALVPRAPQGTILEDSDKQAMAGALNAALGAEFSKAGFKVVSPDWLIQQQDELSGHPDNIEKFKRNARHLAKMDSGVHFLVVGTATLDISRSGNDFDTSIFIESEILDTQTETNLTIPLNLSGRMRGDQQRPTMINTCAEIAKRMAKSDAMPRLIADWRSRAAQGPILIVHLIHGSESFLESMFEALESKGRILDDEDLTANLVRIRYQSPSIHRTDFSRAFRLRRQFAEPPAFGTATSSSDIVIFEDREEFRSMAQAIVENRKYELIAYEDIPAPLKENRPSPAPVSDTPDKSLAIVARNYAEAVGVVLIFDKGKELLGSGTAWAMGPDLFATNAHVSLPVREAMASGGAAFILLNKSKGEGIPVVAAVAHPKYNDKTLDFDVGVLKIGGTVSRHFPIATTSDLKAVESGTPIAYLGFPLGVSNMNIKSPVASMQVGIVIAITDFELGDGGFTENRLVRHSAPSAGGASGSPIFNDKGVVVAVLNAGLTGDHAGAMINYGQRVDLLQDVLDNHAAELRSK